MGPQTVFQAVHRRFNVVITDLGNAIFGCNLLKEFGERDFTRIVVTDVTRASQDSSLAINEATEECQEKRVRSIQGYENPAFTGDKDSSIWSREVSKLRDRVLKFIYRFEIWQASRQHAKIQIKWPNIIQNSWLHELIFP